VNLFVELEAVRHSPESHWSVWSVSESSYFQFLPHDAAMLARSWES